jgi:hypothetical protein
VYTLGDASFADELAEHTAQYYEYDKKQALKHCRIEK